MANELRQVNRPAEVDGYRVVDDGEEIRQALVNGESVMHWEAGNSMFPILKHMEYCLIRPIKSPDEVMVGEPVFCTFHGQYHMVHRCTDKYERNGVTYFQISTTDGRVYGWTNEVWGVAQSTNVFQVWTDEMQAEYEESKRESAG